MCVSFLFQDFEVFNFMTHLPSSLFVLPAQPRLFLAKPVSAKVGGGNPVQKKDKKNTISVKECFNLTE